MPMSNLAHAIHPPDISAGNRRAMAQEKVAFAYEQATKWPAGDDGWSG
jgi:hypothetical protein